MPYKDPEKARAANRDYQRRDRLANPEKHRERRRKWNKAHPGCSNLWHKLNPERDKHCKLLRIYGITLEEYNTLHDKQHGLCAICHNPAKHSSLHVDHDHKTGKVRGLLCHFCNHGLGNFRDNRQYMTNALRYLEKYNGIQ